MAEEYSVLRDIARNSGRDSYITDSNFELLWTNAETPLTNVLIGLKKPLSGEKLTHETPLACRDGRALKITPVITDGKVRFYFMELYGSNDLLRLTGATASFKYFNEAAEKVRLTMLDYARELSYSADRINRSRYGKLCASSVNFMSLLKILGGGGFEALELVSDRLQTIATWFAAVSVRSEAFMFEADVDEELYAVTEKTGFECAVVNLLMNAYLHSEPPEGQKTRVMLTAYADADDVVIVIDDNGCKADPEYVAGFRQVYLRSPTEKGEGLGVSLAQVYCERFGGSLSFLRSPIGGLRAEMHLPFGDTNATMHFFADSNAGRGISDVRDIMRKGFEDEDLEDLIPW